MGYAKINAVSRAHVHAQLPHTVAAIFPITEVALLHTPYTTDHGKLTLVVAQSFEPVAKRLEAILGADVVLNP